MANPSCVIRCNCTFFAVVSSIVIGIVTGILRIMGIITATPAFLWVALGIAVGFLGLCFVAAASGGFTARRCVCSNVSALLTGILGTALTAVILLAIEFAATSVIGAIITGLLLAFLSLILTVIACIVKCVAGCNDD